MEDVRTKATLDALADLFLTGTLPAGAKPAAKAAEPAPAPAPVAPAPRHDLLDQLTGPRPIRMSPKVRASLARSLAEPVTVDAHPSSPVPARRDLAPSGPPPALRLHRDDAITTPST